MLRRIAADLRDVIAERDYAEVVAGLVRPLQRAKENSKGAREVQVFPVDMSVYGAACTDGVYTALVPDDKRKSIFFFEEITGRRVIEQRGRMTHYSAGLLLIGWLNLDRLGLSQTDHAEGFRASTRIVEELRSLFPNGTTVDGECPMSDVHVEFVRDMPMSYDPWAKYSIQQSVRQYGMLPYECFAAEFTVTWKSSRECVEALQIADPFVCGGPAPAPKPIPDPDACRFIKVCGTPTDGQIIAWSEDDSAWAFIDPPSGGGAMRDFTTTPGYETIDIGGGSIRLIPLIDPNPGP